MPKLDNFNHLASSSTGVIRMDRGVGGALGQDMHVSGGAVRGSLSSFKGALDKVKAFVGSLFSKVAEGFRKVGEAFSKTYAQDRAQRAEQAYNASRAALYESVGEGHAASILARVVKQQGQLTPAEVKRAMAEVQELQVTAPRNFGPEGRNPALAMKALISTSPDTNPQLIARRMFEMMGTLVGPAPEPKAEGSERKAEVKAGGKAEANAIVYPEGSPEWIDMTHAIRGGLAARTDELVQQGMGKAQARNTAVAEARLFFEKQLLQSGSATWAVLYSMTVGTENLDRNYARGADLLLAMSEVMKDELPDQYANDLRLNFEDVKLPPNNSSSAEQLNFQIEGDADEVSFKHEEDKPFNVQDVTIEKRWLKPQSVLAQFHSYLTQDKTLAERPFGMDVMWWLVDSPYYNGPLKQAEKTEAEKPGPDHPALQNSGLNSDPNQ